MQSQSPNAPYVGLWTRLEGFQPQALASLLLDRKVARIALIRSTIHLVTARDCLAWRPLLQPALERGLKGTFGKRLAGLYMVEVVTAGRALVEERHGRLPAAVLLDGFMVGVWKIARAKGAATLRIQPYRPLTADEREALADEGARLLAFAAADAPSHSVEFAPAS